MIMNLTTLGKVILDFMSDLCYKIQEINTTDIEGNYSSYQIIKYYKAPIFNISHIAPIKSNISLPNIITSLSSTPFSNLNTLVTFTTITQVTPVTPVITNPNVIDPEFINQVTNNSIIFSSFLNAYLPYLLGLIIFIGCFFIDMNNNVTPKNQSNYKNNNENERYLPRRSERIRQIKSNKIKSN